MRVRAVSSRARQLCTGALALATVLLVGAEPAAFAGNGASATIAATTDGASLLTAAAVDDPGGRAVAIAYYPELPLVGDLHSHSVVIGADRNTYRTIPGGALLSPDGRLAALSGYDNEARVLDLRTSEQLSYRTDGSRATSPLAFSPDGRFLVFGRASGDGSRWVGSLAVLDRQTGRTNALLNRTSPAAAFSPDGRRIAVQVDGAVLILDRTGRELTRRKLPGYLANQNAWSPDGRWLVTSDAPEGYTKAYSPVDPDDHGRPPTFVAEEHFLGWRSATELVVTGWDPTAKAVTIDVRGVAGGAARTIARIPDGYVYDVAGGLLPGLKSRPAGDADEGPWPIGLWLLIAGPIALAALAAWRARRSRR